MKRTTYSLQELQRVNSDELCDISAELDLFLAKIHRNKFLHGYLNPHNKFLCPPGQRKALFPKADAFSDSKLVEDVKSILSRVTEKNKTHIIEQIRRIPFTETCWSAMIEMIHEVSINCVFLIEPLLDVILEIPSANMLDSYRELCLAQFREPRIFDASESILEEPEARKRRWQLDNSRIIAVLFRRSLWEPDLFKQDFLESLFDEITPEDTYGIDIICAIWHDIRDHLDGDTRSFFEARLGTICEDNNYPNRLRFLLMDLLE